MLEVSNLSVSYGGLRALTDVSLTVSEGQFVTVVGPNGAGKSTLFKTIYGLLAVRSGTITFDGRNTTNFFPRDILDAGIAYVPQGRNIFPELSVRHNLELGGVALPNQAGLGGRLDAIMRGSLC